MTKAGDIAKISAKGSFHVLWGLVISTLIGSVGTIFIARLLGSDLYGLYTVVLTVLLIIQVFRDWGINFAMIRFTALYRAEGRLDEIRSVYLTGILFEVILGLALSVFSFFFADFLAVNLFGRPVLAPLIQTISFCIFANGLVIAANASFTGFERLELNSITVICQSIFRTALIIGFVILGFGTSGATIGYTAGTFIAGMVGLALIGVIYRQLPKPTSHRLELKAYAIAMLTYCLPLSFATIITTLLPQFYAFLLPIHYATDNVPIGNYGVALNFVVLITFFTLPITTMMFPAFSKIDPKKDKDALRTVFRSSVKYGSLFVVPVTAMIMSLSEPAVTTLFGDTYDTAALYLSLFAIQYLFMALGSQSLIALLNGQGQSRFVLRMALLTGLIGFPLGYVLTMTFGVLGLITSTLVANVPSLIWGLTHVRTTYGAAVDFASSGRILLSSTVTAIITFLIVSELHYAAWIRLLLGVALFIGVLVPVMLLTKSVTRHDIANLRVMAGGMGAIGRLVFKVLGLLERIMSHFRC